MKQYVFVTVGVPACGKSSFYHRTWMWGDDVPIYISSDDVREELFGTALDQSDPDKVFLLVREYAEIYLKSGHSIYLDATHIKRDWRKYALDLAKKYGAVCIALYFDVPFFTAVKRDKKRDRHVGLWVLAKYFYRLEKPTKLEGFNGIFQINKNGQIWGD